jgi:DNA gyrase subunit B
MADEPSPAAKKTAKNRNGNGRSYEATDIQALDAIDGIRKNPGMYIGGTDLTGMHHLVNEIIDNSIDEFGQGRGETITVTVHEDESISVADDGAGIPVAMHSKGRPTVEIVFTKLHAGGKFSKDGSGAYHKSGGLHGVGATAVNAFSEWFECTVKREGKVHLIRFERGLVTKELHVIGKTKETGTTVHFKPDSTVFGLRDDDGKLIPNTAIFKFSRLVGRMRELAFLNPGLTIELVDLRSEDEPRREVFHSDLGLAGYVKLLVHGHGEDDGQAARDEERDAEFEVEDEDDATDEPPAEEEKPKKRRRKKDVEEHTPIIRLQGELEGVEIDAAFQWTDHEKERIEAYCNNIHNTDGGKHVEGLRTGISHTVEKKAKQLKELAQQAKGVAAKKTKSKDVEPRAEDYRYGLTAVISVRVSDPVFSNQTKVKLVNPEVAGIVQRFVNQNLADFLEENPDITKKVRSIAEQSAKVREAMRKAKDAVRKAQGPGGGKLVPCRSKDNNKTELFLVEGDSAGGTAKNARDATFQAILPLRGKILNVEKAKMHKMLGHSEIAEIIRHVGTGITGDATVAFNEEGRKFSKIIIMTDADVDGSHIRTLLLTFFFRQMKPLVLNGHIYIAQPPLYRFSSGKGKNKWEQYVYSERERDGMWLEFGLTKSALLVPKRPGGDVSAESLPDDEVQRIAGADLKRLAELVAEVEEREGRVLKDRLMSMEQYLAAGDLKRLALPVSFAVEHGEVTLFGSDEDAEAFVEAHTERIPLSDDEIAAAKKKAAETGAEEPAEYVRVRKPVIHSIPQRFIDHLRKVLEKINGFGAKYGFDLGQITVHDVNGLVASGKPAPFAVEVSRGSHPTRLPAFSLYHALRHIRGAGRSTVMVDRFKGLGEMEAYELRDTAMDPDTRTLKRVELDDALDAEELFAVLMGNNVRERYEFIQREAPRARIDV